MPNFINAIASASAKLYAKNAAGNAGFVYHNDFNKLSHPPVMTYSVVGDSIGVREGRGWNQTPTTDIALNYGTITTSVMGGISAMLGNSLICKSNYAISGKTSGLLITEIVSGGMTQIELACADMPNMIYISIGTNDIILDILGTPKTDIETSWANILYAVDAIISKGIIAVIGTILPIADVTWALEPAALAMQLELNNRIRNLKYSGKPIIVIDRFAALIDKTSADVAWVNASVNTADGTHPRTNAQVVIAISEKSKFLTQDTTAPGSYVETIKEIFREVDGSVDANGWTSIGTTPTKNTSAFSSLSTPITNGANRFGGSAGVVSGMVRELSATLRNYVLFAETFLNTGDFLFFFGCTAAGNGYCAKLKLSDGVVTVNNCTAWIPGDVLGSGSFGIAIPTGAPYINYTRPATVHIRDNRYVSVGRNCGGAATHNFPILDLDLGFDEDGMGVLGDTNLWCGVGAINGSCWADNIRCFTKSSTGHVGVWNPFLPADEFNSGYESRTTPPPVAGWAGGYPVFGSDPSTAYDDDTETDISITAYPKNDAVNGTIVSSRTEKTDGSGYWNLVVTASDAGNAKFYINIPVSLVLPERYYRLSVGTTITPDTGIGLSADVKLYRVSNGAVVTCAYNGGIGQGNAGEFVYETLTLDIATAPQYITQTTLKLFGYINFMWSGAGTHTFDLSNIKLEDVTDLVETVTG